MPTIEIGLGAVKGFQTQFCLRILFENASVR